MNARLLRPHERRRACWVALAIAGFTCAPAVWAQANLPAITITGSGIEANARLPLDTTSQTGSRLGLSARETAATINIVDRETIEERGARDTIEAVSSAPGITEHGSPGSGGVLSYRGFTSSQITQMFNGIDVGYIISTFPVDAWILDRVEVLGGASSFLYGSGAVGGAVNYVSKLASRQPIAQETLLRAGSFGQYQLAYGMNGRVGDADSAHFLRVDLSTQGSDGYVERTDARSFVFAGSWLWEISSRLAHTLAWEYQTKDQQPYWGTPLLNPTVNSQFDPAIRFKNFNAADGAYEQDVQWFRSILDYRLSDATQIKNTLYHYDADRDYRNVEQYRYNAANTLVTRNSAFATAHGQSLIGDKIELLHKGTLFGMPSTTSLGFDISHNKQTRYPSTSISPVNTVNPLSFTVGNFFDTPGVLPATNPDRTNRVDTQALYAENLTRFAGQWSLITGLRAEHIKLAVQNFRAVNAANPLYFQQHYSPLTGRIGMMVDIAPSANAYLTYSTAADPPAGILSTTNYGPILDWDLTTGDQVELGSKFDFLDGRGNATLAAYKIVRKNLSTPDPDNPNVSLPIGQQSSRGIEAQAGIRLNPQWRLQGNLALVSAQYDKFIQNVGGVAVSRAGNRPTSIPARVANLYLTWDANAAWSATLEARHVGDRYVDVANVQRFDAYTLWGASVSWKIDRRNTLTLRGRNLGDEIYFSSGSTQVRIGEPRAFELALQSKF
ncbi:MAG: TonB-dependent siderophore receptor [Sulfuritalea sp.]|nr:TonB-dependent siderophore receptor [Sulfuritalea sp.]MDP1981508.1 TonB-dependent siderophore receptor [Sulfuritalea sp.]